MYEVGLEGFDPCPPVLGLASHPLVSLKEALEGIPLEDKELICSTAEECCPEDEALTKDEQLALYVYTCPGLNREASFCAKLNSNLRCQDRSKLKPYLPFIKLLNSAISKRICNVEQILWSCVDIDLHDMYSSKIGKTIVFWGYTSTTIDMNALNQFIPLAASERTLFSIRTNTAADLHRRSALPDEKEMLIAAGTVFKVVNVYRAASNLTIVELKMQQNLLGVTAPAALATSMDGMGLGHGQVAGAAAGGKATDAEAMYQQGLLHENGTGVSKDETKARQCYEAAAAMHHAAAQEALGFFYSLGRGGLQTNDVEAVRLHRLAAAQGNARGQNNLGWCYMNGHGGMAKDEREAVRLYRLAADQGNVPALYNLGCCYRDGREGIPKDVGEAKRLWKLAADQGFALAAEALKLLL